MKYSVSLCTSTLLQLTLCPMAVAFGLNEQPAITLAEQSGRLEEIPAGGSASSEQSNNFSLVNELQRLREEVRELRGELENQSHSLEQLQHRQQKTLGDFETRLRAIESNNPSLPAGTSTQAPALGNSNPVEANVKPDADVAVTPKTITQVTQQSTQAPAPATAQKSDSEVSGSSEQDVYDEAFNLLKMGRYDDAIAGFGSFLSGFPDSRYADSAKYWLGETYYVKHQYEPAITAYQRMVKEHPSSQRLTQALLKIGYSYHELGQTAKAVETLEGLRQRYPSSTAARLAEERLRRIKLEQQ